MTTECDTHLLDGRYRLCEPLARGGTATVWRAVDERLGRAVAVKVIAAGHQTHDVRSEAQALARLSHPHIANVFDYAAEKDRAYLVVELVEGESLSSVLLRRELPWEAVVACGAQIASALAAAHARGLVHRDVKPGNIMLTRSGTKLIDFGISAIAGAREADPTGALRGTPAYMAPERLHDKVVGAAGDVYSLGVVMFRALSGGLPSGHVAALETDAPPEVVNACLRCLAKNPAERPTAAELADVLGEAAHADAAAQLGTLTTSAHAQALPTHLMPPLSVTEPFSGPQTPRRRLAALATAVIVLGALAFSAPGWSRPGDRQSSSSVALASPSCDVTYQLQSDNGGQLRAAITASNRTERVPSGWRLSMRIPAGGFVPGEGWQSEAGTVTSAAQPALEPGSSAELSLSGSHDGIVALPTVFQLNGDQCEATLLGPPTTPAVPQPAAQSVNAGTSKGADSKGDDSKGRGHGGKKGR
jgi:serine/threonine-protein kinase